MSEENNKNTRGGIGFCGLLTILFIGLKLTGYISWSWWWVLGPMWIPLALVFSILGTGFAVAAFVSLVAFVISLITDKKNRY